MVIRRPLVSLVLLAALTAAPALARPGGMWGPGFGYDGFGGDRFGNRWDAPRANSGPDSREGKVDAESFVAQDGRAQLGHGAVSVTSAPGDTLTAVDGSAYEAAIIDQLVKAGYDTAKPDPAGGQLVELKFLRDTVVPEEAKRKPVSGEASIGISNRGTAYGMAIAVDMTKPKKALLSTRLDAQIRDRVTGATLWEGHATVYTRDGDSRWSEQGIATRLAAALFDNFPNGSTTVLAAR